MNQELRNSGKTEEPRRDPQGNPDAQRPASHPGPWAAGFFVAVPALVVLAALIAQVLGNYYLRPYSDALVWLKIAEDPAGFRAGEFPLGYPFFLAAVYPLVGLFGLFLANLPLLALIVVGTGVLAWRAARDTESDGLAGLTGVLAAALLLAYTPHIWTYLTNPSRDPLAHVLLLAALLAFFRFRRTGHAAPAAGAGLLLGLAYFTREPAILALGPIGLLMLADAFRARTFPWRAALAFLAGLGLGLLPIVIQQFALQHTVSISPYSTAKADLLPGLQFTGWVFAQNGAKAFDFAWRNTSGIFAVALLVGLPAILWRRNRAMIWLVAALAIGYFCFYSFYWTFAIRYFFITSPFIAILAAFGLIGVVRLLTWFCPRWTYWVTGILTLIISLLAAAHVLRWHPEGPLFRIADGQNFRRDMRTLNLPTNAAILAPRNLCEVIQGLTPYQNSYPLPNYLPTGEKAPDAELRKTLDDMLPENGRIFYFRIADDQPDIDWTRLQRYFDLTALRRFPAADYHMQMFFGNAGATLYRLQPRQEAPSDTTSNFWNRLPGRAGFSSLTFGFNSFQPADVLLVGVADSNRLAQPDAVRVHDRVWLDMPRWTNTPMLLSRWVFRNPDSNAACRISVGDAHLDLPAGAGPAALLHPMLVNTSYFACPLLRVTPTNQAADLLGVQFFALPVGGVLDVAIGTEADVFFCGTGFFPPEKSPQGIPYRWTGPEARIMLPPAPPRNLNVRLDYFEIRPAARKPARIALFLNGQSVPISATNRQSETVSISAAIPAALWAAVSNPLLLRCENPWNPARDLNSPDPRDLGVQLLRLKILRMDTP